MNNEISWGEEYPISELFSKYDYFKKGNRSCPTKEEIRNILTNTIEAMGLPNFLSSFPEDEIGLQGRTLVYKLTGYLNSDSGLHATPIKNRYPPASPAIVYHCIHPKRRHAWQVAGRCRVRLIILLPEVV